jgi:hypothetical protein
LPPPPWPPPPLASLVGLRSRTSTLSFFSSLIVTFLSRVYGFALCQSSRIIESRKIAHKFGYLLSRPRGGMKTATPRVVKELVLKVRALAAGALAAHAALGVFSRFEITDVNFLFLLFAHITFLSCVFGFGLCQSRRTVAVPLRPFRLGSGPPNGSTYFLNASAVEHHAPQNLRPIFLRRTHRRPINTKYARRFLMPLLN